HTRFKCDWSSYVCSSDLLAGDLHVGDIDAADEIDAVALQPFHQRHHDRIILVEGGALDAPKRFDAWKLVHEPMQIALELDGAMSSEERRVGKGQVYWWMR